MANRYGSIVNMTTLRKMMLSDPTDSFCERHSKNNDAWEEVWQLLGFESLGIEKEVDTELIYRSGMKDKTGDERSGADTEEICMPT
jgi:hypothetical protein